MKIEVYGNCCHTCQETYSSVLNAAKSIDPAIEVTQIGDVIEIIRKNILQTPTVIIDNKIVSQGRHLSLSEATDIIRQNL